MQLPSLFILVLLIIIGCTESTQHSNSSIDDVKYRNAKYFWWDGADGSKEWVEIAALGNSGPTDGVITEFYNNGKVKLSKTYTDNEANGAYKAWNKTGDLVISGKLKNNRPDSIYQLFYPNGQIRAKYTLENCLPERVEIYAREGVNIASLNFDRSDSGNFLKGDQYLYYSNGNPRITFKDSLRTIFSKDNKIVDQSTVDEISTHHAEVTLQLLTYYMKKAHFAEVMSDESGCISGDCDNGTGTFVDDIGASYQDEYKDGFLNGKGSIQLANGDMLYSGKFLNGMFDGFGTYNGSASKYTGQFKLGTYNGMGEITFIDKSAYSGSFLNGYFHGEGIYIDPQGTKLVGPWNNGEQTER